MKKALWTGIGFFLALTFASAQDSQEIVKTHMRNFAIASLDVKIQILQDAGKGPGAKDMGSLCLQAVEYVLDNISLVPTDARFRQLAVAAVEQIGSLGYTEARQVVWRLFLADPEPANRTACMQALASAGRGDVEIVQDISRWLQAQNEVFRTGKIPDLPTIGAAVKTLGALKDPASFPVLFTTMVLQYSEIISNQARTALLSLEGDLAAHLNEVIRSNPQAEKVQALAMALESDRISDDKKGAVAEFALDIALHTSVRDSFEREKSREIRFLAVRAIGERKWSKATPLVIEHFDATLMEVDRSIGPKSALLEAIACLGDMGTKEAAVRLTQYLILLNSYAEKNQGYDEQTVLAVINSLGKLGNKVAFDDLMYTQYLGYSANIKKAARAALESLKW